MLEDLKSIGVIYQKKVPILHRLSWIRP
jgi:hypothetical protein